MKSIKKITKTVAGSALLVGATLAGAASMGAAQSGSSGDLGDYPAPFVDEDGEVDSTIVVGESAKTADVVGGLNIAASLGNAAFTEETASTSGGSFGWSATNGVTLDTQNDALYFGETIDEVRQTLTDQQLPVLETQEVLSGDEEQDLEQYVYLGDTGTEFSDTDDDTTELNLKVPESPSLDDNGEVENYLMRAQANFQEGVQFNDGDERNDDVYGEEVEMFGSTFTIGDDSFSDQDGLVLYGSTTETSVATGESTTLTVGDQEVEVTLTGVTSDGEAVLSVGGDSERLEEDESVEVNGEDVRVTQVNNFGDSGPSDSIELSVGSQQVLLEDGSEVQVGSDEDEVDGTMVNLEGTNVDSGDISSDTVELSSISIGFGAEDSDEDYLTAGQTYENPVFNDLSFTFAGLNPDAGADETPESVGSVEFDTDGDDTATVDFDTSAENSVSVDFSHDTDGEDSDDEDKLELENDEEEINVVEGAPVAEDEYVVTDAGDFSHMWEVTGIDTDATGTDIEDNDEAEISLRDVATGNTVEVDLDERDGDGDDNYGNFYSGTEVIDGQTYNFVLEGEASGSSAGSFDDGDVPNHVSNRQSDEDLEFAVTYDSEAGVTTSDGSDIGTGFNPGDQVSVYPALDTRTDSAVALTEEVTKQSNFTNTVTLELPSTDGTSENTVTFRVNDDDQNVDYRVNGGDYNTGTDDLDTTFSVGDVTYSFDVSAPSNGEVRINKLGLADDGGSETDNGVSLSGSNPQSQAAALVMEPEDDSNREDAFAVAPYTPDDDEITYGDVQYTDGDVTTPVEQTDDLEAGYTSYGSYVEYDSDEQGTVTLDIPTGQSVVGAAVHGPEGSVTAGAGSGSVTSMEPTYGGEGLPGDFAALDSEVTSAQRNNQNMILVGGPAVNTLVSELADENMTMTGSEYSEGDAMVQMVEGAFSEGNDALVVAGYAADDTRAASQYIANYAEHAEELAGQSQVMVSTGQ